MGDLHVDFGGLLGGLDQAEGLVEILPGTVDAVQGPDNQAGGAHLLGRGLTDLVGAAEHPGQHIHTVGEDHNALGAHLPERAGELPLVQAVDIGHGEEVGRVAVHDHMVLGIDLQARHMAHHVGGELAGELTSVGVAPEQLGVFAAVHDAHQAEVHVGGVLDVLEIFAGAGDEEILALQLGSLEAGGNGAQDVADIEVLLDLGLVEQQGDVAAVALIPAVVVHVGGGADHLHQEGSGENVFHGKYSLK